MKSQGKGNQTKKQKKDGKKNMLYGNSSMSFSYSPDRSRDVDRYNPSTKANYYANTRTYGCYNPNPVHYGSSDGIKGRNFSNGHYDGRGQWVED